MSNNRTSIYVGEPLQRVLDHVGAENRSGRINDIAGRYDAIISDELARLSLTANEWAAIVDANNGTFMHDEYGWRLAFANVQDTPELDAKWGVDRLELARKIGAPSIAMRAAVAEVIERFWSLSSSEGGHTRTLDQMLAQCGVTPCAPYREAA